MSKAQLKVDAIQVLIFMLCHVYVLPLVRLPVYCEHKAQEMIDILNASDCVDLPLNSVEGQVGN